MDISNQLHEQNRIDSGFFDKPNMAIHHTIIEFIQLKAGAMQKTIKKMQGTGNLTKCIRSVLCRNDQLKLKSMIEIMQFFVFKRFV